MAGSLEEVERKKMVIAVICLIFDRNVSIFRIPSPAAAVKISPGRTEVAVPGLL